MDVGSALAALQKKDRFPVDASPASIEIGYSLYLDYSYIRCFLQTYPPFNHYNFSVNGSHGISTY